MTTYKYEDEHWKAGCSVLFMHLALIIVGTAIPVLWFRWDGDLCLLISMVGALIHFVVRRKEFRFEVPENSSYLVTWDDKLYAAGPGVWWKSMGADVKEDNKFSKERKLTTGNDTIPCKDGARIEAKYGIQWSTIDAAIYNVVGQQATEKRLTSHAENFFGQIARNGGTGLPDGDALLLKKDQIADQFAEHFENDAQFTLDLKRRFGVRAELGYFESPLDYDAETRKSLAIKFARQKAAEAEQFRRGSILADAERSGVSDSAEALKLMAAIDGQSDVSITGFNLGVDIHGLDPETARALADILKTNPALATTFAAQATSKGKKGVNKDGDSK